MLFQTSSLSIPFFCKSFCKCLFLIKCVPLIVFCVKAFALNGSMEGLVSPHIILLLALGAIAKICANLFPVPSMSGASPLSFARHSDSLSASSLICLKIALLVVFANTLAKGIFLCCKYE